MRQMTRAEELAAIDAFIAAGRLQRIDLTQAELDARMIEQVRREKIALNDPDPQHAGMRRTNNRWSRRRKAKLAGSARQSPMP